MHFFMSLIGYYGTLIAGSGLSEILSAAFAEIQKLFSEKKFPQSVRVIRIAAEEILKELVTDMGSPENLPNRLEKAAAKSPTVKLWADYIESCLHINALYVSLEEGRVFLAPWSS